MDIANALITKAEIATYKISQFAEELREVAKQKGYNANTFLSGIKSFYIDKLVSTLTTNPQLSENFSSNQEIVQYMFNDVVIEQPVGSGLTIDIQGEINKDNEKIHKELTTHYDVFVKEGDDVVIYPNREAIINARFADNPAHANTIEVLTAANTSDESFRQALNGLFVNDNSAPIDLYVKYRNVQGIESAIANRRWTQEYDESVIAGKLMRNTVMAIMFDREDQIEKGIVSDPAVYAEFRKQVKDAYLKLTSKTNGMGLTVVDCNKAIYGTDYNGNRISSEADLIATDGNKLYAIDIRYSFQGLRDHWNTKYPKATFTVGDHVTYRLKQVEQIINSRFKRGVNGLYCLGVVYNPVDNILTIDIKNGSYFIPVKPETQDHHDDTVEALRNSVETIVSEINKNIKEYNTYAEEARKFVDGYPAMPEITPNTFESVQEYNDYLNQLHGRYDTLQDRINEMKNIINQQQNLLNEVWNTTSDQNISIQDMPSAQQQYQHLRDICADLDLVLDEIPSLKITTQAERNNVNKLVETIFDAQFALDELLRNPEAAQIDLRKEEELIATALEKMVQNKDNFGKASMFVRKWWTTNFSVGTYNNTSESVRNISEMMFGYANKIKSWVDTLQNHVLSELADHVDLQEWYSAVLNNYFSKLLDNAETFTNDNITEFGQKAYMFTAIKSGRNLIEKFNGLWDTRPEEGFDGPSISPEVDRINRLPVRWMDKWSMSDSIMPAFD
jgi:hypothetical protein